MSWEVFRADPSLSFLALPCPPSSLFPSGRPIPASANIFHQYLTSPRLCANAVSMLWNWNTIDSCFISSSWRTSTRAQFAGSVIGVFFLVVGIEAVRRLGREYDRRLVAASRARQRRELVAGGFGPSCAAQTGSKKECPKTKAQSQKTATAPGACCGSKTDGGLSSSSSSEMGGHTYENIQLAEDQKQNNNEDLEADLPVFK